MSGDFVLVFMGVILGYILGAFVSLEWAIAIVVLMLIVAVFYKPEQDPP